MHVVNFDGGRVMDRATEDGYLLKTISRVFPFFNIKGRSLLVDDQPVTCNLFLPSKRSPIPWLPKPEHC